MRDFTLNAYKEYINALKTNGYTFLDFSTFLNNKNIPDKICLVRHDVDRKPGNALNMANLENEVGVISSYYFRMKKGSYNISIIQSIEKLGHEIGYHYETLSDAKGGYEKAYNLFAQNLKKFRDHFKIKTICMHGRPFSPYDNRALWENENYRNKLKNELNIDGELYLDIDYENIAYISDTGRNWHSSLFNKRDKVNSNIKTDFASGIELLQYFKTAPNNKIVFQIHPERWSNNAFDWTMQKSQDQVVNLLKSFLS